MYKTNPENKSQSVLDFVLAFIAIAFLAVGVVRVWGWFNANYAHRQVAFQKSRVLAGNATFYESLKQGGRYPAVDINATASCPDCSYRPLNLTEEWLFAGVSSGMGKVVSGSGGTGPGQLMPEDFCRQKPVSEGGCSDSLEPQCWSSGIPGSEFTYDCPCYTKCICTQNTQISSNHCTEQAQNLRGLASQLRDNLAKSMRDAAERCDDPWDICWWGSFGSNANSLRKSAENLEKAAERLENKATALDAQAAALLQCCQFATREEQEHCFETIPAAGGIGTPQSCPEAIRDSIDIWAEEIREDWRTIYLELAPQIAEIAAYVIVCDWTAIYPIPGPDPCCMKYPPQELIPWLRPCHRPNPYRFPKIDECDIGGILRKCSLDKILADLVIKVNDYMDEIDSLNDKITRMRNCCILNNPEEWMKCIDDIDKEE